MKLNRKNKKGFTIVELVIVIAVIGILAAILIPTFTNLTKNAQESAKKQTVGDAYTVYLAEAVDGKYDLFTRSGAGTTESPFVYTDANITLPNKKQSEVVMKYKDEYFTYNQEKGWENKGTTAPTGMGSVVCQKYEDDFTAEVKLYDTEHELKFTFANESTADAANVALSTFNSVIVYSATVNA